MNKNLLFTVLLFTGTLIYSQVGINTNSPMATLDVKNNPNNPSQLEGIIAPRITGDLLRAKSYTSAQNGALVYVIAADTAPSGQTVNVTARGYYYYDSNLGTTGKWVPLNGGGASSGYHKLRLTANDPIVIQPDDYTIGYTGRKSVSTTLPSANNNPQRMIRLCTLDEYAGEIYIKGLSPTQFANGVSFVATQNNQNQACYLIQSDGNAWYVIGSFK